MKKWYEGINKDQKIPSWEAGKLFSIALSRLIGNKVGNLILSSRPSNHLITNPRGPSNLKNRPFLDEFLTSSFAIRLIPLKNSKLFVFLASSSNFCTIFRTNLIPWHEIEALLTTWAGSSSLQLTENPFQIDFSLFSALTRSRTRRMRIGRNDLMIPQQWQWRSTMLHSWFYSLSRKL